jgi:hypothetical protein
LVYDREEMKMSCTDCADFYGKKIKTKKCLRNTNTSFPLILINFIWSDRFRFGPTDFHGLSDRMSDTFFYFREVCLPVRSPSNILKGHWPFTFVSILSKFVEKVL